MLTKKHREETDRTEWVLLSKDGSKVLYWFGPKKPSEDAVEEQERRVQYWKSKSSLVSALRRLI